MSGKSLLWIAIAVLVGIAAIKALKPDSSNPDSVVRSYLENWQSNNTSGMYPLISGRAKSELAKQNVGKFTDYYAYFTERHIDLSGFEIATQDLNDNNGRYWVVLRTLDMWGREVISNATFHVVHDNEGWRVDGWEWGGRYQLP